MPAAAYCRLPLPERLAALFGSEAWQRLPDTADLCLATGSVDGRELMLLATDPQRAKGTLGVAECRVAAEAVRAAAAQRKPLLLLLDSAGARLDAGLAIQGALRRLVRELLDARLAGLPMYALLGHHVFGGASLLAFVAPQRGYAAQTLLAMSGPRVLQGQADSAVGHGDALHAIAAAARCAHAGGERLLGDAAGESRAAVAAWLAASAARASAAQALAADRVSLSQRLGSVASRAEASLEAGGLRFRCGQLFGAADALALAGLAARAALRPGPLLLRFDCPGHSLALQDESLLLSHYLAHLALSLRQLVNAGTELRLRIEGEISGGIYVALASAASSVELAPGAVVRTLPRASLAHILKDGREEPADPARYLEQGVVDAIAG